MNNKGKGLIIMGLLLIAAALFLTIYNFADGIRAEKAAGEASILLEQILLSEAPEGDSDHYVLVPEMEMPVKTIDGVAYIGMIRIQALNLSLPVVSQWSYTNLKTAPCRYSGSAYQNNLILCGHNYRSHFGNLKQLRQGDVIFFEDMDGNTFSYHVEVVEILPAAAVEEMESGDWDLTLFTCTVGGQNRVTVRCEKGDH